MRATGITDQLLAEPRGKKAAPLSHVLLSKQRTLPSRIYLDGKWDLERHGTARHSAQGSEKQDGATNEHNVQSSNTETVILAL